MRQGAQRQYIVFVMLVCVRPIVSQIWNAYCKLSRCFQQFQDGGSKRIFNYCQLMSRVMELKYLASWSGRRCSPRQDQCRANQRYFLNKIMKSQLRTYRRGIIGVLRCRTYLHACVAKVDQLLGRSFGKFNFETIGTAEQETMASRTSIKRGRVNRCRFTARVQSPNT
jgi:hypothetical protein